MSILSIKGMSVDEFAANIKSWIVRGNTINQIAHRVELAKSALEIGMHVEYDPSEGYTIIPVAGSDAEKVMRSCWNLTMILEVRNLQIKCKLNGVTMTWKVD